MTHTKKTAMSGLFCMGYALYGTVLRCMLK